MTKLRAHNIAVSLDGYSSGPNQSIDAGLGEGGEDLHAWYFEADKGPVEERFFAWSNENIGATIMGRNMFGPVRGPWPDDSWTGWWGDEPPYHHPVFVLTHHAREPIEMAGGTTFNFVTDGIESALAHATEAANGKDVRLGGGASAIQQYMRAGLVDMVNVTISPMFLGGGERLFEDIGALDRYEVVEQVTGSVTHVVLERR